MPITLLASLGGLLENSALLLDGFAGSAVIGASLVGGAGASLVTVATVFLPDVPKDCHRRPGCSTCGAGPWASRVWGAIALAASVAAFLGNVALTDTTPVVIAAI